MQDQTSPLRNEGLRHAAEQPDRQLLGELQGADERERVELWLCQGEDGDTGVELVQYHWGSGVGWYVQKRMALDGGQARALQALLAPVAKTIPFRPAGFRPPETARPRRPRVERDGNVIRLRF